MKSCALGVHSVYKLNLYTLYNYTSHMSSSDMFKLEIQAFQAKLEIKIKQFFGFLKVFHKSVRLDFKLEKLDYELEKLDYVLEKLDYELEKLDYELEKLDYEL